MSLWLYFPVQKSSSLSSYSFLAHYVWGKSVSGSQNTARARTAMGDFPSSLSRIIVYRTRAHSFVSQIDRVVSNLKVWLFRWFEKVRTFTRLFKANFIRLRENARSSGIPAFLLFQMPLAPPSKSTLQSWLSLLMHIILHERNLEVAELLFFLDWLKPIYIEIFVSQMVYQ